MQCQCQAHTTFANLHMDSIVGCDSRFTVMYAKLCRAPVVSPCCTCDGKRRGCDNHEPPQKMLPNFSDFIRQHRPSLLPCKTLQVATTPIRSQFRGQASPIWNEQSVYAGRV